MTARVVSAVVMLIFTMFTTSVAMAQAADAPIGAAACSGCHATAKFVETPVPRLIGRNAADIVAAMQAFKTGTRPATIMDRIAKGFTETETLAIANWYGAQKD